MSTLTDMSMGLDTVLYHLNRAKELTREIRDEQAGMPETHVLEGLAMCEVDIDRATVRLGDLISWIKSGKKAA